MAEVNTGEIRALAAVMGYCTDPGFYYNSLPNVANEITNSPTIAQTIQALSNQDVGQVSTGIAAASVAAPLTAATAASGAACSGSGPSGSAPASPVCWSDKPANVVPYSGGTVTMPPSAELSLPDPSNAGLGDYPPWGDAFGSSAGGNAVSDWVNANPGIVAAALLAAVALLWGKG